MKAKLDPGQFLNQKGVSVQHYLIQMINRILTELEKNSREDIFAVVANLIDYLFQMASDPPLFQF